MVPFPERLDIDPSVASSVPATAMQLPPKDTLLTVPVPEYVPLTYVILTAARAWFIFIDACLLSLLTDTGVPHIKSVWTVELALMEIAEISVHASAYG